MDFEMIILTSVITKEFTNLLLKNLEKLSLHPKRIVLFIESPDKITNYTSKISIDYVESKWSSFANAVNQCLKQTDTEIVCISNNDIVIPDKKFFEKQLKLLMSDDQIVEVGQKTIYPNMRIQDAGILIHPDIFLAEGVTFYQRGKNEDYRNYSIIEPHWTALNCKIVKKDLWGFLDENYVIGGFEDWDKEVELTMKDYISLYNGLTYIFHYEGRTCLNMDKNLFTLHRLRNQLYFRKKWIKTLYEEINKDPGKWRAKEVKREIKVTYDPVKLRMLEEELKKYGINISNST